jgi:hypothetical protein
VNPLSSAKYVAFQSLYDPKQMPLRHHAGIDLPYVEGLRIDEAMNPTSMRWLVRIRSPEPKWRADPSGSTLEVRVHEYQVDRQDSVRRQAAPDYLEHFEVQ